MVGDNRGVAPILADLRVVAAPLPDPQLQAVATAVLLEDVFGITLTDDEICPAVLGDPAALDDLVRRRRGL